MAAKTFDEFWKIIEVPHSRQGGDYVFIKELSEVVWKAATKAAEEKFTAEHNVPALAPTTRPAVKLPEFREACIAISEKVGVSFSYALYQGGMKAMYDYIRQLQA